MTMLLLGSVALPNHKGRCKKLCECIHKRYDCIPLKTKINQPPLVPNRSLSHNTRHHFFSKAFCALPTTTIHCIVRIHCHNHYISTMNEAKPPSKGIAGALSAFESNIQKEPSHRWGQCRQLSRGPVPSPQVGSPPDHCQKQTTRQEATRVKKENTVAIVQLGLDQ